MAATGANTASAVLTQQNVRFWRQPGGARPNNPVLYAGVSDEWMAIEGLTPALAGDVEPIYAPNPFAYNSFTQVGETISTPDIASFTLMLRERKGKVPLGLRDLRCPSAFYGPVGKCKNPDDFARGWSDYVHVISEARPSGNPDMGARNPFDGSDPLETSLDHVAKDIYGVGLISFGAIAAAEVDREVVDVVYGSQVQCGDCGPQDNGSKKIYAITKSSGGGSPGLPAELIYTLDGGGTVATATITGIGATEDPLALAIAGSYIIVLGLDAYYWAELNANTGAPGAFTKVSGGFIGAGSPNDLVVVSASEIYLVGDGGYIYRVESVGAAAVVVSAGGATTNNLTRISWDGADTLVAVGASGTVIKSENRGQTWATTTTSPSANAGSAVEAMDRLYYWFGDGSGGLFYTLDGGETWVQKAAPETATAIRDIVFTSYENGYIAYDTSGPAGNIGWTLNGGYSWHKGASRMGTLPTNDRINRIAVPQGVHPTTRAGYVALAALAADGTDGALFIGVGL